MSRSLAVRTQTKPSPPGTLKSSMIALRLLPAAEGTSSDGLVCALSALLEVYIFVWVSFVWVSLLEKISTYLSTYLRAQKYTVFIFSFTTVLLTWRGVNGVLDLETFASTDAGAEPTWMYSRRVSRASTAFMSRTIIKDLSLRPYVTVSDIAKVLMGQQR